MSVDLADRSENGITFFRRKLGKNNPASQKAHVPHEVTRFIQTGQPLRLGRRGDAHRWDGLIADFKLSAATLSEHDIASETHRNPVLHWQFRNATAIGQDISGQNNHAVVDHDTHQQLLSELRAGAGALRLVRALGDQGRQAGLHVRIRSTIHLGLGDVPRLVQGQKGVRQRPRALGVLPCRVECTVLRRPRLPDQRNGEKEPALGGKTVP